MSAAQGRLDFRIDKALKERIERAAALLGVNVSQFALLTLAERAQEVLERHHAQALSDRDRDVFLAMLESEETPNAALARAAKGFKARRSQGTRRG